MPANVCPHGVCTDYRIERTVVDDNEVERWCYNECLKCTESIGAIVLMKMLADNAPPSE